MVRRADCCENIRRRRDCVAGGTEEAKDDVKDDTKSDWKQNCFVDVDFARKFIDEGWNCGDLRQHEAVWRKNKCKITDDEANQLTFIGANDGNRIVETMSYKGINPNDKNTNQGDCRGELRENVLAKT